MDDDRLLDFLTSDRTVGIILGAVIFAIGLLVVNGVVRWML